MAAFRKCWCSIDGKMEQIWVFEGQSFEEAKERFIKSKLDKKRKLDKLVEGKRLTVINTLCKRDFDELRDFEQKRLNDASIDVIFDNVKGGINYVCK